MRERTEINATIQKLLKEARDKDQTSSFSAIWERVRKENLKLFGDLEAQDWMEDDKTEEQEKEETHAFEPSAPSQHQFSFAEHKALFAKLQGPKKVEATNQEGFICVGGFSNPLF